MCLRPVFVSLGFLFSRSVRVKLGLGLLRVSWIEADSTAAERDSRKDEAVVFIFIFATAGLLIWAAIKPWVGKLVDVSCCLQRAYTGDVPN